ncbi:MAG: helix-turn-helix domain-containing protein [Christensenellaceae bacterium]|jgi:transcriptional regulator with XRE-family HTH domain|nr:helix-turn-helix domain-containing protein [Christensenellaceae bacterium]
MMNNLKLLRTKSGMKQIELANMLGIAQSTLSGWETSKFEIDTSSLEKLSHLFQVSVGYILGLESAPFTVSSDNLLGNEQQKENSELLDAELANLLQALPPEYIGRVKDFMKGILASR